MRNGSRQRRPVRASRGLITRESVIHGLVGDESAIHRLEVEATRRSAGYAALLCVAILLVSGCGSTEAKPPLPAASAEATEAANAWQARLEAAEDGDPAEQYAIGMAYEKGAGVRRDPRKAATWIMKAAKRNFAPAQNRLGFMHTIGAAVALDNLSRIYQRRGVWP